MRVIGIVLLCAAFVAACSGGEASPSAVVPSEAAPSVAPASVEPSVAAASIEPSESAAAEGCMDAAAYAILASPSTDFTSLSAEDREKVAVALETYEWAEGTGFSKEYIEAFAKLLRTAGSNIAADMKPFSLWSGEIVIVPCA